LTHAITIPGPGIQVRRRPVHPTTDRRGVQHAQHQTPAAIWNAARYRPHSSGWI